MSIIEVKDLSFSYTKEIEALKKVSFKIEKGSYTTIIGHNGSGKSTIAKLLAGLLVPNGGEIYIDGVKLEEKTLSNIRNKLGIVFQNPDNQFIGSTVRDDIAFGLENHNVDPAKMDEIIDRFADVVNMSSFLDKEPNNLYGGQKQRVAIAGVLAMGPKIIIFDESTSMLDPKGKDEIKKVIYELHGDKELTIISITHDIEEALKSDHTIVMNQGEVFMDGIAEEIFKHDDKLLSIGLDIPFTYKVCNEIRKRGHKIGYYTDMDELAEGICQLSSRK